jgi:hypothetical protein
LVTPSLLLQRVESRLEQITRRLKLRRRSFPCPQRGEVRDAEVGLDERIESIHWDRCLQRHQCAWYSILDVDVRQSEH